MWRLRAAGLVVWAAASSAWGQVPGLAGGPMYSKARAACLGCHDSHIIVQQQLDRATWVKEMDKMIRFGSKVDPADRDALIEYFATNYGPREVTNPRLAKGPGEDKIRADCLGCHDTGDIANRRMDRREWSRTLDQMNRYGAKIPTADRAAILDYLDAHYPPPPEPLPKKSKDDR